MEALRVGGRTRTADCLTYDGTDTCYDCDGTGRCRSEFHAADPDEYYCSGFDECAVCDGTGTCPECEGLHAETPLFQGGPSLDEEVSKLLVLLGEDDTEAGQ